MKCASDGEIAEILERARALVAKAEDAAAKQAYLKILRRDPTHVAALNELGTLAYCGGFRSAARTAYLQAVQHHPGNKIVRVNLANLLREEQDVAGARLHYEAALAIDPDLAEAHQGMAWVLQQNGDALADWHWRRGYSGHSIVRKPYRGLGSGVPLLLLVSARGGNIPTQLWITDRQFAVSAIYAEFYDPEAALPPHALIVNAVGDADLCDAALAGAEEIASRSKAPVINPPARVRHTGRVENARRLCCIEGVVAPIIRALSPAAILAEAGLQFPLLLRRPGFHTGRHFVCVKDRDALAPAIDSLGGKELLVIPYLDARGADGMARKYRVMFIDGAAYALHLAISADWKVHYFSAAMQDEGAYRDEERRFLEDMPAVLGPRAMRALAQIQRALGLDYGGVDFALAPDGSVLLFEANATMVIAPPSADPMWDYRRRAIGEVMQAATRMLLRRTNAGGAPQTLEHDS